MPSAAPATRRPARGGAEATAPRPIQRRGPAKTRAIVAAAQALFLRGGYGATSMDAVAREAGVSKATLYGHFAGKDELFAAIIQAEGEAHASMLLRRPPGDLRDALRQVAGELLDLLLSPATIAAHRMIAAEAARFPALGGIFYRNGPALLLDRLARLLEGAMLAGELRRGPPRLAAAQFVELVRGELQLLAMLGVTPPAAEREAVLEHGLDSFLRAHAP